MRHLNSALLAISVSVLVNIAPSFGQDLEILANHVKRLADCTERLDAGCAIALSDIEGYQRLSKPAFNFPEAQTRFFSRMRELGYEYTDVDISAPTELFRGDGRVYAFLPYTMMTLFDGRTSEMGAYFIGISRDGGRTWKFIDGRSITQQNILRVIPSYGGQQLPTVTGAAQTQVR